ncbi:hypothetical protein HZA43_02080 [Candidatus Peregrinibacteria bacterium]|nr:hypothetical protein [Candidatus Peregrinibacteria bacterium]
MKVCTSCQQPFEFTPDEQKFLKKMEFHYGDAVVNFPEPTDCPDCRNQIRTAHRNEQYLYHRKSDLSGKQLISLYSPTPPWGAPYRVYTQEEWWSDQYDPLEYGRDFDFNRPFFDQWAELSKVVPRLPLMQVSNDNSPFTTGTGYCRNCHLINSSEYCEDCYYGKLLQKCKNCVDCSYMYDSERCYECFDCRRCQNCAFVTYNQNCSDCWFSENLTGCTNCFLCTNLSHKEYHFMNRSLSKDEYKKRIQEFKGSYRNFQKAKEIFEKLCRERIHKYAQITNSENCTGDFIEHSHNCLNCFDMNDSEDCRYVWVGVQLKDVYDCSNMYVKPELNYQVLGTIETFHVAFSLYVFHSQDIFYSEQVFNSKNCFGCVGLKKHQYCIFNKRYTKEAYEAVVPKIVAHMQKTGEWGQFFPVTRAPHAYNETLASEYYPMEKEAVLKRGWNWYEKEGQSTYQGPEINLSDHIRDTPEDVTEKILKCASSGRYYKIIPQELQFCRSMQVPLPRLSPDERHRARMKLRNPRHLHSRACAKCSTPIQTIYSTDRPEIVYCEACYLKEVY